MVHLLGWVHLLNLWQLLPHQNPGKWQEYLLTIMGIDDVWREFVAIVRNDGLGSEGQRVATFESAGLGDRATYYRWKRKLAAP